ncbi:MAG: DUF3301 domain-containing protein [Betaproteobacteria bacterium]|nr:DUF3301 domain-containing protein [Betaproteobacteria bacterium]
MDFLAAFGLIAALAWFWYDSMRAREAAVAFGEKACAQDGFQFLDQTVALESIRVARNRHGRAVLRRTYRFEFSDDGWHRRRGCLILLGDQVELMRLGPLEVLH